MAHDIVSSMMAGEKKSNKFSEPEDESMDEEKSAGEIEEINIKVMGDDKFMYKAKTEKGKMMSYILDSTDEVMDAIRDDLESPHIRLPHQGLSAIKARKILHDKEVRGNPLTKRQRGFFGAVAGGKSY